ncbi:dynein light chain Tctex-type 5-like [Haliotis cracherodii]|uniref:dynein light chain Tctex-type 5-like n=1 Tax=Haliotis cracherodii TaxID=6455 RepID=UPI0039ECBDFC
MEGLSGHRMPPLRGDNSLSVPVYSTMSQNGPFRLAELRKSTPTKRKSKSGNRSNRMPPIQGASQPSPKVVNPGTIERTVEDAMVTCLQDVMYDTETCIRLSKSLAGTIMEKIKPLSCGRYKMVAVVSIGNIKEQSGMQFGSRCLWNKESDSFLSVKYANDSLFAVAMVYSLLFE